MRLPPRRARLGFIAFCLLLPGCGLKGNLYLPPPPAKFPATPAYPPAPPAATVAPPPSVTLVPASGSVAVPAAASAPAIPTPPPGTWPQSGMQPHQDGAHGMTP